MRWRIVGLTALFLTCSCGSGSKDDVPKDWDDFDRTVGDVPRMETGGRELPVDGSSESAGDAVQEIPATLFLGDEGGVNLEVGLSTLSMTVRRGDEVLFAGSDMPLMVGVVEEFSAGTRYDPEFVHETVRWVPVHTPIGYSVGDEGDHRVIFEPEEGLELELIVWAGAGGEDTFSMELSAVAPAHVVNVKLAWRALTAEENFYGLGENFDHVARRGTSRQMYHAIDGKSESGYNEAHFPIPLLISTTGSGVFVEDRRPGFFDVCEADESLVQATFSTSRFRFHLLVADTPLEVLSRYVAITGNPALPPQWTFGVLQWRNEVSGQAMVMEDAEQMRQLDLPCSGIWVDRPFATGHESFVFDPAKYPDSAQMVKDLNALGYRVAIWSAPYLSEDVPEAYEEAEANGYFVESPDIKFENFGKLVDFTNPGLVQLWQSLISNATDIGIEGFKLDYGEDVLTGGVIFGQPIKFTFNFHNGETEQTMHHWYHYFYHKTYQDMLEGDGFLLNRAGCYGDQTVTTVCWPGDLDSDYHFHREDGHVGGLPAAIAGGLSLSVSGYPFYGSDTGGYRHNRPTKEVLLRWVQYSAFGTTLQFGGGGKNHNPWDFTQYVDSVDGQEVVSQYDEETVDIWRKFSRLHVRLFPYTYTYAVQAGLTGIPVLRPLGMVHPELNVHPDFHYFLGADLWVAPAHRGSQKVETYVPPGRWIHWFNGQVVEGPGKVEFEVPLDEAVLLAREGAIIPMLRETVDTLAPAADPDVDSFVEDPGDLVVRVFAGEEPAQMESVLGPRISTTMEEGGLAVAWESVTPAFTGLRFQVDLGHLADAWADVSGVVLHDGQPLEAATALEETIACVQCFYFDSSQLRLFVRVPPESSGFTVGHF